MMTAVLVSNKTTELDSLSELFVISNNNCELIRFTDPLLSMKYVVNNPVDIILVEAHMRPTNGVNLLKMIRKLRPAVSVVILAADERMREQAARLNADGYWLKPITDRDIAEIPLMLQRRKAFAQ